MRRYIGKILYWVTHRFFPELTFNSDMSLEIDRLLARIDELESK